MNENYSIVIIKFFFIMMQFLFRKFQIHFILNSSVFSGWIYWIISLLFLFKIVEFLTVYRMFHL